MSSLYDEQKLIEKLRRIEALFSGAKTEGERSAAAGAAERIRARLREAAVSDPPVEYKFTLSDAWSRMLLAALLKRYGVRPYRYRNQRHTTIMARVSRSFVNETLWPEFDEFNTTLKAYLMEVTQRVVSEAISAEGIEGKAEAAADDGQLLLLDVVNEDEPA